MIEKKVAVITPTIGTKYLKRNLDSVSKQTYKTKHVVVIDGPEFDGGLDLLEYKDKQVIRLPENTGAGGYNGHRIYGAVPFLIEADYFIFLDEDNWIDENHVQSLVEAVSGKDWAYSLRKIVDKDGSYICNDDCESLGLWPTCLSESEFFVDVGCYFLPRQLAIKLAPIWYRRARHPQEQPEVDRMMMNILQQNKLSCSTTGEYTLNYMVGNRSDSVQAGFFENGNKYMQQKHNGVFPWRKENLKKESKIFNVETVGPGIRIIT
jgi:glycosyltransferase involved in cell wall biosynthesis